MSATMFLGRTWRFINRRISRLYLRQSVKVGTTRLERAGSPQNGWYIPTDLPSGARCYCIGVGLDASFDFALAERGAEVHAFDPTPMAVDYMERENRDRVAFHPWGVMDEDTTIRLYEPYDESHGSHFAEDLHGTGKFHEVPCLRFQTILERLNHAKDSIYLIKMDIEGSWFPVVPDMIRSGVLPTYFEVEYDSPGPLWRVRPVHRALLDAGYTLVLQEDDNAIYHRQPDSH